MRENVEYKTKTWERRGHTRKLSSGKIVYVRPTQCSRHDDAGETYNGPYAELTPSRRSVAVALDELLAAHDASADAGVLTVGKYAVRVDCVDVGRDFRAINVALPRYLRGNRNDRFDAARWGEYDTYAELCAIRACVRYLTCAVAELRGRPVAGELDLEGNAAETYVAPDALGKSRRHVRIRNVDICFASNEENAGVSHATVRVARENGAEPNRVVIPIWCCPLARRLAKLTRDVAILSSERGERRAAAAA